MSPAAEVQQLVDALASELHRPVGLDSRSFRSLAYSSHPDHVDDVRLASILHREAPPKVVAWLEYLEVQKFQGFGRVAAHEGLGMAARVCVPVRFDDLLLGFLWLIDEPGLSDAQLEEAVRYATDIAVALYRERVLDRDSRQSECELLRRALPGGREPEAAATELVESGHLVSAAAYLVLVLRAVSRDGEPVNDAVRVRLAASAENLRRTVAPHHILTLIEGNEAVAVFAPGSTFEGKRAIETFAVVAAEAFTELPEWEPRIGVGERVERIRDLAHGYRQARIAVSVFAALGRHELVVSWADLGAYQGIAPLVYGGEGAVDVPRPLQRLLASNDSEALLKTLECYLDQGGDARATAAALYIHRSSLYGRLRRLEEIADVDLRSGEDRLQLHLGIRMLRLKSKLGGLPTFVESPGVRARLVSHPRN